jgi:serine/threonine protein kinase HipA of HipAB toxin-antitoxin module
MTDPADLAHDVLLKVAAFVKSLPADQLADLASGEAKLSLVPRGGRAPSTPAAARPLSRPVAEIETMLAEIGTRAAAVQYLNDERLTVAQLRELAKVLGVALPSKATKDGITTKIVDSVVGRRLDASAIDRMVAR